MRQRDRVPYFHFHGSAATKVSGYLFSPDIELGTRCTLQHRIICVQRNQTIGPVPVEGSLPELQELADVLRRGVVVHYESRSENGKIGCWR